MLRGGSAEPDAPGARRLAGPSVDTERSPNGSTWVLGVASEAAEEGFSAFSVAAAGTTSSRSGPRRGEVGGATAAARTPSVGKVRLAGRNGLRFGSWGNKPGSEGRPPDALPPAATTLPTCSDATAESSPDASLTPRWACAMAISPNTSTVANADTRKTMRFMGTLSRSMETPLEGRGPDIADGTA